MVPNNEKPSRNGLTGSRKPRHPEAAPSAEPIPIPPGLKGLEYVLQCTYGHYPWDDWEKAALAAGVSKDLAGVGRLTMREAFQHLWDARLQSLCGWHDQGRRMIKLALRWSGRARRQWGILMRTDGLRGDYRPRATEWVWGFLKADARRLAGAVNHRPSTPSRP